ncbi:hypothetical protein DPMN_190826, partial [Dreissena polymorpha]
KDGGTIPGSKHVGFDDLWAPDCTLKPTEDLRHVQALQTCHVAGLPSDDIDVTDDVKVAASDVSGTAI